MTLHNLDIGIALAVVMLGVSLLITILTQTIATLLCTRGAMLRRNLQVLFESVYPEGKEHAKEIAYTVLTDKLISDSTLPKWLSKIPLIRNYRLATAVRVEEVIGALDRLAHDAGAPQPAPQAAVAAVALGNPQPQQPNPPQVVAQPPTGIGGVMRELVNREIDDATPQIEAVGSIIRKVREQFTGNPGEQNPGGMQVSIDRLIQTIPGASEVMLKRDSIKSWFNSSMDRASQQFAVHMRIYTIICSILVAYGLHLDTFRFLGQVSSDPELRAGLVNASQAMQNQAAAILAQGPPAKGDVPLPPVLGISSIYKEALTNTATENKVPNLDSFTKDLASQHFASRDQAIAWLRSELSDAKDFNVADLVDKFQVNADKTFSSASKTDQLLDHASAIRSTMDTSEFKLLEDPYIKWDYARGVWYKNQHFWGILFSAGLLSLGAPFWFNALKTISSLRPVVASKEEQERQAA
jgi:hypothetical protein